MTEEQKTAILANTSANLSADAAAAELNAVTVDGSVVKDGTCGIEKPLVSAALSDEELVGMHEYMAGTSTAARAMKIRWDELSTPDMCDPMIRANFEAIKLLIPTAADKITALLALGERPKTLPDEILGRLATAADIKEARA